MTKHIETRKKLKQLVLKEDFGAVLSKCILSDRERKLMDMFYLEQKTMMEIAEELGFEEISAIKMHERILKKISEVI